MRIALALVLLVAPAAFAQTVKSQPPAQTIVKQAATGKQVTLRRPAVVSVQEDVSGKLAVTDGMTAFVFPSTADLVIHLQGSLPKCPAKPPIATRAVQCPVGFDGSWTQTQDWQSAAYPTCWVAQPWAPTSAPAGACAPTAPPPFQWQAPRAPSTFPLVARPAKGGSYVTPYGTTVTRVTDAQADAGVAWLANWYNRFEAVNADGSLLLVFQPDGFWDVFDAHSNAFVKRLAGPAGDAEIQWDATDPNVFYYLPTNGGTVLKRYDVAANTSTVQYDFTADAHAIFPNASRYWTKSEGSPTADGRSWGLWAENNAFTAVYGFVKIDIVAKAIVWSMPNPNGTSVPDNVTISPSGRWFVVSGMAPIGTKAYATDGTGRSCTLHTTVEHADIGKLSNGHDFIVMPNFTTGNMQAMDIDTCARLDTSWPQPVKIYGNPWLDNTAAHSCAECGVHPSAKAYAKPGWVLLSFYGVTPIAGVTPAANVIALNVETGAFYGVAASYAAHGGYWDEAHFFVDRTFSHAWGSENWNHPGTDPNYTIDVVRIDIPEMP